jgi:hypothetical protein
MIQFEICRPLKDREEQSKYSIVILEFVKNIRLLELIDSNLVLT